MYIHYAFCSSNWGVLYYTLLWQLLGVWVFEHIGMPIMEVILPDNPNILEGIVFTIFGMLLMYIIFFVPYIIALWLVVIRNYSAPP